MSNEEAIKLIEEAEKEIVKLERLRAKAFLRGDQDAVDEYDDSISGIEYEIDSLQTRIK